LYVHLSPSVEETIALQQRGWRLDASLPGAYHHDRITQQWSLDIADESLIRVLRFKQDRLTAVRQGVKSLEVRVGYKEAQAINPGEYIKLASRSDEHIVRIKDVRRYETLKQALEHEDYQKILPDTSRDEVLRILQDIYPPERETLGVVVLEARMFL